MTSKKPGSDSTLSDDIKPVLADWLLAIADDKFMLGHRNSDWTRLAPFLEEDLAFSSIAQDEIAHAQALYTMAGTLIGKSADQLAYGRKPEEYRCAALVERADGFDYARALVRQFFYDLYDSLRLPLLVESSYRPLAELAGKMAREERFHLEHLTAWIRRLGRANDEARDRVQRAVDALWPDALMLFEPVADRDKLCRVGHCPPGCTELPGQWLARARQILSESKLVAPTQSSPPQGAIGGRRGTHTDDFHQLRSELNQVYDPEPDAVW